jgi:integrase
MLLESLKKYEKNYERDYCIITLFLHGGMRLSELTNIKIDDIKEDTLTIIGKGDKERTVYLDDMSLKALDNYIKIREDYNIQDGRLFNIKEERIEQLVKNRIINAGIEDGKKFSPHKLRHTTATLLYKHGNVGIAELKEILGHENINTTMIYTHIDNDDIREAVKSNPLNNIL